MPRLTVEAIPTPSERNTSNMATAVAPAPQAQQPADVELMEFAVDRNQLLTEVAAAARVSDTKSTQPLLSPPSPSCWRRRRSPPSRVVICNGRSQPNARQQSRLSVRQPSPAQKLLNYLKLLPEGRVA